MVYSLGYRRPPHQAVGDSQLSLAGDEKQRSIDEYTDSGASCPMSNGIPSALSFDRIVNGGTCPPCTLRDFMNYLKYIEHDAENLQFYLWAKSYIAKFDALPASEKALSPEWTDADFEKVDSLPAPAAAESKHRSLKLSEDTVTAMKGTGLDGQHVSETVQEKGGSGSGSGSDMFDTPPRTPGGETERGRESNSRHHPAPSEATGTSSSDAGKTFLSSTLNNTSIAATSTADARRRAEGAYDDAGVQWQPFTIQPYRDELSRIITLYIATPSPRQLNLSARERRSLLHALSRTTHPSALRPVLTTVEWSLRCQAHPNFIRWTICNGNRPRVVFARGLGTFAIPAGLASGILITLSSAGRAWRVLPLVLWFVGFATLIAAVKGMCVVLHGLHHRHLRPWELFAEEDDGADAALDLSPEKLSCDSADSALTGNSFEDEPWVARYKRRNVVRKVFDRQLWVQEPALRQIQDTIFLQAVLGGLVVGAVLTAVFVAVPAGRFY